MIGLWTYHWLQENQFPVHYFPTSTSTNLLAKEAATHETHPVVFYVTDAQTQGRGQGARSWINSDPGTNLLITCSLQSGQAPQPELCLAIGAKLHKICSNRWPQLSWRVKPPNDLYLAEQKVAGILLESISQGSTHRLLVGLGFNILNFPHDPSFEATSLQKHLTQPLTQNEWNQFLTEFIPLLL